MARQGRTKLEEALPTGWRGPWDYYAILHGGSLSDRTTANYLDTLVQLAKFVGGSDGRMARAAGAYCVLDSGQLVLYLERGGRSLLTNGEIRPEHLRALVGVATNAGRVEIQRVDGLPVMESPIAAMLREAGFASSHRGLVATAGVRDGRRELATIATPSGSSAAR